MVLVPGYTGQYRRAVSTALLKSFRCDLLQNRPDCFDTVINPPAFAVCLPTNSFFNFGYSILMKEKSARFAGLIFKPKNFMQMELRELKPGSRFEFEDKKTALVTIQKPEQMHAPTGTFVYVGLSQNGAARLFNQGTGKELILIAATHLRHVIPLF